MVKALRYKQAGLAFDSRWCHWNFFSDIILPQQEEDSLYQKIGLKFEEETSKMLRLEHGFVWC